MITSRRMRWSGGPEPEEDPWFQSFAKPAAAIVLLTPGLPLLKEWAYAGATFALVMAFIAARALGDGPQVWVMPLVLVVLLAVSYVTRPRSRRVPGA